MPDALSAKLRDPEFLRRFAETTEATSEHIRHVIAYLWELRDELKDVSPEAGLLLAYAEYRALAALAQDARTLKVRPLDDGHWDDLEYEARGPRLVVDQTVYDEESTDDGA